MGMFNRRAVSDTFLSHSSLDALDMLPPHAIPRSWGFPVLAAAKSSPVASQAH